MSWRLNLKQVLDSYPNQLNKYLNTVYAFGVYTGESIYDIKNIFNASNLNIRKMYCFDSFEGLPKETEEEIAQESWSEGGFNASKVLGVNSVDKCIEQVDNIVRSHSNFSDELVWVPGYFNNVLNKNFIKQYNPKPALYIDIDCDLYSSTITALDFLYSNKLIKVGTIIGYDDYGGTKGWYCALDGESRAHKEMCEKYNVVTEKICQFGNQFPHVHTCFIVRSIK